MLTEVHEPVDVGVVFHMRPCRSAASLQKDQVRPVWFLWRGRKYPVVRTTYRWKERRGEAWFHFFSVFDGTHTFELIYDAKSLCWQLGRVSLE